MRQGSPQNTRAPTEAAGYPAHLLPQAQGNDSEKLEYEMAKDLEAMRAWLIERISKALKVKGSMDPDAPLSKYGLQSIDAVILAMEIEEEVGVELPPTLLWEYNTVNECGAYLVAL
jgi:acyl carrier protein